MKTKPLRKPGRATAALAALAAPLFWLGLAPEAAAQRGGEPLPLQGRPLPEVTAHDDTGATFPLRERLAGRHAVIVFGCLT